MKQFALCTIIVFSFLWVENVSAQELPKFGKVSKEVLQLSVWPEAASAKAIFLFEVGELRISPPILLYGGLPEYGDMRIDVGEFKEKLAVILEKRIRIKIMTEAGIEYASAEIPYKEGEKIHDLKALTILPNGKKIKLKNKAVREEQVDSIRFKRFTFPDVEIGSVVEYKYRLESSHWMDINPWYFQNKEFTILSQITLEILPNFDFHFEFKNTIGFGPHIKEELMPGLDPRIYKKKELTWKMENLPGIKTDSKMGEEETQGAAIRFQLRHFKSNFGYINFLE